MQNPLRWLALVVLEEPELPEFKAVANYIGEHFEEPPAIEVAGQTEGLFTCSLGDYTAAVTLVTREIPWSQLEGPCETAWYWPDASNVLREHPAHLLITLVDEGTKAVEQSTRLTQLVAGVAANSKSKGVFWGPGRLVHPKQAFLEQAVQMTDEDLPLFLWIDFRVERTEQQVVRLYTTGLEALGYTEIEVPAFAGQPQELLEYAYNIAHYQLTQHKHIGEGETIGLTDQLQAIAHHEQSMFDAEMEVVRLEFQTAESS